MVSSGKRLALYCFDAILRLRRPPTDRRRSSTSNDLPAAAIARRHGSAGPIPPAGYSILGMPLRCLDTSHYNTPLPIYTVHSLAKLSSSLSWEPYKYQLYYQVTPVHIENRTTGLILPRQTVSSQFHTEKRSSVIMAKHW